MTIIAPSFPSLVGEGVGVGSVISSLVGQYRPHPQPLPLRGGESGWAIQKRAGRADGLSCKEREQLRIVRCSRSDFLMWTQKKNYDNG